MEEADLDGDDGTELGGTGNASSNDGTGARRPLRALGRALVVKERVSSSCSGETRSECSERTERSDLDARWPGGAVGVGVRAVNVCRDEEDSEDAEGCENASENASNEGGEDAYAGNGGSGHAGTGFAGGSRWSRNPRPRLRRVRRRRSVRVGVCVSLGPELLELGLVRNTGSASLHVEEREGPARGTRVLGRRVADGGEGGWRRRVRRGT